MKQTRKLRKFQCTEATETTAATEKRENAKQHFILRLRKSRKDLEGIHLNSFLPPSELRIRAACNKVVKYVHETASGVKQNL